MKVLGSPLGHPDYVSRFLEKATTKHDILLSRTPLVPDLQSVWLILLHCAAARANFLLRVVKPDAVEQFAHDNDQALWQCLGRILHMDLNLCEAGMKSSATLPLSLGGLGLRSAMRTRVPAHWSSWTDCLPMVHSCHPDIATRLVVQLEGHPTTPCLAAAVDTARQLVGVRGFEPPSWRALLSARPPPRNIDDFEPGSRRPGWQHEASSRTEQQFRDMLFAARLSPSAQATIRSQGGPGAGMALMTCPTCRITTIPPQLFRHPSSSSPSSSSPDRAFLPVWPLTRCIWPSPCSLRTGWGVRQARMGS